MLCVIRWERSRENFENMLPVLVNQLPDDFRAYFTTYYVPRAEKWALCYRDPELPDTTAHPESFHRVLKHVYMQGREYKQFPNCFQLKIISGKRQRRCDKLIEILLEMEFDYNLKYTRYCKRTETNYQETLMNARRNVGLDYDGVPASLKERIRRAAKMDLSTVVQSSDLLWRVDSDSGDDDRLYIVIRPANAPTVGDVFVCPGVGYTHRPNTSAMFNDGGIGDVDEPNEFACQEPCPAFRLCGGACRHVLHCGCADYTKGFTCKHILVVSHKLGNWSPFSFFTNPLQQAISTQDREHSQHQTVGQDFNAQFADDGDIGDDGYDIDSSIQPSNPDSNAENATAVVSNRNNVSTIDRLREIVLDNQQVIQ